LWFSIIQSDVHPTNYPSRPSIGIFISRGDSSVILNILSRRKNHLSSPEANADHPAEGKKNAKRDAQTPDGLHFIASGLASSGPDPVVYFAHVHADRVKEGWSGAGRRESGTVEIGEWFSDCDSDDDYGDEDGWIETSGD
jgi:hypothetical protein